MISNNGLICFDSAVVEVEAMCSNEYRSVRTVSAVRSTTFNPADYRERTLNRATKASLYYRIIQVRVVCFAPAHRVGGIKR